jgi:hypothetical protein
MLHNAGQPNRPGRFGIYSGCAQRGAGRASLPPRREAAGVGTSHHAEGGAAFLDDDPVDNGTGVALDGKAKPTHLLVPCRIRGHIIDAVYSRPLPIRGEPPVPLQQPGCRGVVGRFHRQVLPATASLAGAATLPLLPTIRATVCSTVQSASASSMSALLPARRPCSTCAPATCARPVRSGRHRAARVDAPWRQGRGQDEGVGCPVSDADVTAGRPRGGRPPRRRRLSDHILIAFHFACDQGDFEVADRLLGILQRIVLRPAPAGRPQRRSDIEPLAAAHERLWTLRHPEADDQ